MDEFNFDFVIIGAGPAGLAAAQYASRGGLSAAVLESAAIGGQVMQIMDLENYPGIFPQVNGIEFINNMKNQAEAFGAKFFSVNVSSIDKQGDFFIVKTKDKIFKSYALLIATGAIHRNLEVKGEKEFFGRGVSYCAVCDGAFYRDKVVAVVGGGNAAVEEGCYLTKFAKKVYIIHRRDQLRADKIVQERAFKNEKVEFIYDTIPLEILGEDCVTTLVTQNVKNNQKQELKVDGVFPYIGFSPNIEHINAQLKQNEAGFIVTDETMQTSQKGVFAAGDVRTTPLRQVITAASDGAIAGCYAVKYLEEITEPTVV